MKSERFETVTVLAGLETFAKPTGVSLIERLPPDAVEPDSFPELEPLPELEPEELAPNPLFFARVSTSQTFESATKVPLVVTFLFKITFLLEYSADFTELESVPIVLSFEPNFEAASESSFQPMY